MLTRQHTLKSSAQKVSKSTLNNSHTDRIEEIYGMLKTIMAKLDTLDDIQKRIVCVEQDFKQMKTSLEFAHRSQRLERRS